MTILANRDTSVPSAQHKLGSPSPGNNVQKVSSSSDAAATGCKQDDPCGEIQRVTPVVTPQDLCISGPDPQYFGHANESRRNAQIPELD